MNAREQLIDLATVIQLDACEETIKVLIEPLVEEGVITEFSFMYKLNDKYFDNLPWDLDLGVALMVITDYCDVTLKDYNENYN